MKYRIYIDEVGNNDIGSSEDPNHRFLSLTGVVFELEYVRTVLTPDLESLKIRYFNSHPDEPIILHRKELINKKFPFKSLLDPDIEKRFNDEFLFLLDKWKFSTITVLIDKLEHKKRYTTWRYDPYHYCMTILFERFHLLLIKNQQKGDMMFEARGGKEDMRLKESYKRIFENGTDWVNPEEVINTYTSSELKIKPKSANISGIQLADLLAHPLYRYALHSYRLREDTNDTFNDKIMSVIESKIYKVGNKMDGFGLKLLP